MTFLNIKYVATTTGTDCICYLNKSIFSFHYEPWIRECKPLVKPQDLLLIRNFARIMKRINRKIENGQVFEKAKNLGPYLVRRARKNSSLWFHKVFSHLNLVYNFRSILEKRSKLNLNFPQIVKIGIEMVLNHFHSYSALLENHLGGKKSNKILMILCLLF